MRRILAAIARFFQLFFSRAFGSLQYQPPQWWTKFTQRLGKSWVGKKWAHFSEWKASHPQLYKKRARIYGGSTLLALVILAGIKMYIEFRPKPDYVTIRAAAPAPMSPELKIPDTLNLYFSKSAANPSDLNKAITAGIEMTPPMNGTWAWKTDRNLSFTPNKEKGDWAVGQEYEISFKRNFFPSHLVFESRSITFKTEPVKVQVSKEEFYIDPRNPDVKKVVVNLHFNYPVFTEDVRKRIDFELQDQGLTVTTKKIPFTLTSDKYQLDFYLSSENLSVPKNSQKMIVTLDKGVKAIAGGPSSDTSKKVSVSVPSRFEALHITNSVLTFARNEKYEPEQILVINTSADARTEDVAKKLSIQLLPADRPAVEGDKPERRYHWVSISEVTPEALKSASEVPFQIVPSENEWSRVHTFKIQTEVERGLYVDLKEGLVGLGGYEIKDRHENVIWVPSYPQELSIMSQGSILTLSGDLKLPLLARNVGQVEFTIHRVLPDQVNHLLFQMNGEIAKPELAYGLESQIAEKFQSTQQLSIQSAKATQYFSFDLAPFLAKSGSAKGLFLLKVKAKNKDNSEGASDQRLIMVTDLGLLVKETVAKNQEVFVQNFRSGNPVEGATVEVIGTNGLTVLSAVTDLSGHATFPDLKDFKNEKNPIAFSVRKGSDQAFLPFRNYRQNLQYSRFDISGLYETNSSDQLMSMIFSDRGIYRPGEDVSLGLILRSKKGKQSKQTPPLEWAVTDPKGNEILREKISGANTDLKELHFSTDATSPTGTYDIRVYLIKKEVPYRNVELIGTQTVKVEEFQPDRIKIQVHLNPEKSIGWITPQEMKAHFSMRNMFGTAAEKRTVHASIALSPTAPVFRDYKDYTFTDLNSKDEQVYHEDLGDAQTNEKGEVDIPFNLSKYQSPLFNLRLNSEGFESEGGRSVSAVASALVSPLPFILGAKADGDLYYLKKDSARSLKIIAINPDLKMTAADSVLLAVVERKYVSVLTQGSDGTYKYQSVFKENLLSEKPFAVTAKGSSLNLDTSKPGDYTLVFRNAQKMDLLKINYSVVGVGNLTRSLEKNAELQLSLNKTDFKNGEDIEMQIKAPYKGAGLISIERDGVYATKWFKTTSSTTMERIRVPEGLDGNAYINVTFLRAIDSDEIYTSPLSYAVAPFSISLDEHKTQIKLDAPTLVKPGQKLQVKYSANKKTDIILYGVDEGILQVAHYKLPEPLGFFFQKRALQVKTYQMLDLLLPEFSVIQEMQAAGGDGGFGAIGKNLNPFRSKRIKPVVFWSGVISADTKPKTFTYSVPDSYNGNIKIMAVAAGRQGLGSTQTDALVRGDLIITPNVPVFVSPSDEFTVGVNVANQTEGSGADAKVKLETTASSQLQIVDGQNVDIGIAEGHDANADIRIKALNQLGVADLTFSASLNKAKAKTKWEVSVRPATPYVHFLQTGLFGGGSLDLKNSRAIFNEYGQVQVAASGNPFVMATGLMDYLDAYPYGCTEQLVSKALPMLILRTQADFVPQAAKAKDAFKKAVQILRSRQRTDGGFALYNPAFEPTSWPAVSLYAAHYLIEAKAKGLAVPEDVLRRLKAYIESPAVRVKGGNLSSTRRWAYSLYLDARLGSVDGASLSQLLRELDSSFKGQWEKDIVAIYLAGVYSLYKQDEQGEKLMHGLDLGQSTAVDTEDYLDPTVRDSTLLYIAGKHYPALLKNLVTQKKLEALMAPINQGNYQSHSVARLLLALDAISSSATVQATLAQLELSLKKADQLTKQTAAKQQPKTWKLPLDTKELELSGPAESPVFYAFTVSGFDQSPAPIKKGIEVARQYKTADGKEVTKVALGEEIVVHLQARSLDHNSYSHLAMVDLIPAGFELVAGTQKAVLETEPGPESSNAPSEPGEEGDSDEGRQGEEPSEGAIFWRLLNSQAYAQTTQLMSLKTTFVDEREDRLVLYFTVTPDLGEYTYRLKAVNKGTFTVPPPFAEGMYNREIQFLGAPTKIEVTDRK
jgi:uncharacterized protein YfaS (alpha-2-macroglobulin family)